MANFLKSKIFLSVLFLGLAAFIVGGITMAWFTSDADLEAAEFTAGTVEISSDEDPVITMPEMNMEDVLPGDCATVIWKFKNIGSEAVQLKVKLNELWDDDDLDINNVYYCPVDQQEKGRWVMADDENGDTWLYYLDNRGQVPGRFDPDNPEELLPLDEAEEVELQLIVVFDLVGVDNDYQGATYTIGGEDEDGEDSIVCAIQASNQAPDKEWSEWEDVTVPGYKPDQTESPKAWDNYDYFHNSEKRGTLTDCWRFAHGQDPYDPTKRDVTITYLPVEIPSPDIEQFDEGSKVVLIAKNIPGYKFDKWEVTSPSGLGETYAKGNKTVIFFMPAQNVELTAKYIPVKRSVKINYQDASGNTIQESSEPQEYGYLENVSLSAPDQITKDGNTYNFDKWVVVSGLDEGAAEKNENTISFNMPNNNVVLTAKYKVEEKKYTVTLTQSGKVYVGFVEAWGYVYQSGDGTYAPGESVTVWAVGYDGLLWEFGLKEWQNPDGSKITSSNPYTFPMPAHDVTLNAYFW